MIAQWLVALSGVWLIGVSIFMLARPRQAIGWVGRMASTNLINYTEITLRMIWGIALLVCAPSSAYPAGLAVAGWFIAGSAAILYLVPRRWHARYAAYWSGKLTAPVVRACAPVSLVSGLFLVYAAM